MEALKGVTLNPTFQGGMKDPKNHTVPQSPHSRGLQPLNSASSGISVGILCSNSPKACQVIAEASEMDIILVDNDKQLQKVNQVRAWGARGSGCSQGKDRYRHKTPKTERQREGRGRKQGEGQGVCPRGQRTGLNRKIEVYKGKTGNPGRKRCLILIVHVN